VQNYCGIKNNNEQALAAKQEAESRFTSKSDHPEISYCKNQSPDKLIVVATISKEPKPC
jgi:hypothetical protein